MTACAASARTRVRRAGGDIQKTSRLTRYASTRPTKGYARMAGEGPGEAADALADPTAVAWPEAAIGPRRPP